MSFRVVYTKTAFRDIRKLDAVAKKKIKGKIELFLGKPFYYSKKLLDSRIGSYRWRVGNYRIVFDVVDNTIVVLRVGHIPVLFRFAKQTAMGIYPTYS